MSQQGFESNSTEVHGCSGGPVLPPSITVSLILIGIICIFFGYAVQEPYLRATGIASFSVLWLMAWHSAMKR